MDQHLLAVNRSARVALGLVAVLVFGATGVNAESEAGRESLAAAALWQGASGASVVGQFLSRTQFERIRVGAEFEYGARTTELLGIKNVDATSYTLRCVLQGVAIPDGLSPYAGVAIGLNLVRFEGKELADRLAELDVAPVALGAGGVGFLGIQLPLVPGLQLFTEARGGLVWNLARDASTDLGAAQLRGWSGIAGLRMSF